MSDQYIGEIRLFVGKYAPEGWAICDGSTIKISDNQTLFAVLGTAWGGDGINNFKLPDLRGRVLVHVGKSQAGTNFVLGQYGGAEAVALLPENLPLHTHPMYADALPNEATATSPSNAYIGSSAVNAYSDVQPASAQMASTAMQNMGAGQPHSNMMPYFALTFIIATQGNFPSSQ